MKIIATEKMSAGNDTVGDMWHETWIFDETATLKEVMSLIKYSPKRNIILSVGQETKLEVNK